MQPVPRQRCSRRNQSERSRETQKALLAAAAFQSSHLLPSRGHTMVPKQPGPGTFPRPDWTRKLSSPLAAQPTPRPRPSPAFLCTLCLRFISLLFSVQLFFINLLLQSCNPLLQVVRGLLILLFQLFQLLL